ncbi:MAG: N-acetylmuramoyl-L-alanine amidase [Bacteroidales bacterium]|nr:N-acetylmuramoyl-L-alanine amidase [Bacteroidales bacterium]
MPINVKRLFHTFLVSTFFAFIFIPWVRGGIATDPPKGIRTVVIDAGHGGRDPGAVGKRGKEKDIALSVALKVGGYIEENIPDVEVIYTRKTDVFVELQQRAEIANNAEADLFISIHVNAHTRSSAKGTLTLVLGQHRADENFDVAVRENSVILLEDDYETVYEGFDPKSTESYIMFSLMQKTYFKQSIEFGDHVQDQFRERAHRRDLGVREQGLLVLAQTSMPGVLVETGFISNPEEEKYLLTQYGQEIIASAIYRGFKEYKEMIDRRSNLTVIVGDEPDTGEVSVTVNSTGAQPSDMFIFSIQLASSKNKIATDPSSFKGYKEVMVIQDGRWFKYMVGKESSYHTALQRCKAIKSDYPDAFVVASKGGKIVPLNDALEEINHSYENKQ